MRRATTPTHTFTFPDSVLVESLGGVNITYSQNGHTVLEKNLDDLTVSVEDNTVSYTLTQEETNQFAPGRALVQVRVKSEAGVVLASQIIWLNIKPVLNSEEM